ncbi:MAG TPA: Crp/Fnr family transcriptional regulator [Rhizomicrobium sp.]|jgi:CRP-like cAMP-binding protein
MPAKRTSIRFRNQLLQVMSADDLALLQPNFQPVPCERSKTLESANKKIEAAYFMEHGIASVVGGGSREVEIGIIGYEGVTGLPIVYGNHRSPHHTFIQVAGRANRISAAVLRSALEKSATLRALLLKYAQCFHIQSTHTAIANARGTIEGRLARWIVMAQDRIAEKELPITHEFLSIMLAVRRPGVTEALHALARRGLIRHDRGIIVVIDRQGLIERANGLYGVPEAEYLRLIG